MKKTDSEENIIIYKNALLQEAHSQKAVDSDVDFIKEYFDQFLCETKKKLESLYDKVSVSSEPSNKTYSEDPCIKLEFRTFWEWL